MELFSKFKKENKIYDNTDLIAIANAQIIPIEEVKDPVFSKQLLGQTLAMKLEDNIIVSPCNGILEIMYATGHAFAVRRNDGMEILVHVGLDTVRLNGNALKHLPSRVIR